MLNAEHNLFYKDTGKVSKNPKEEKKMALYPIHAGHREALGLFKAHSSDYASSEGGLIVELKADGNDLAVANAGAAHATDAKKFGLLDEQSESTKETMLGKFIPANQDPVVLGPATHLSSGRVSVFLESGWFLTDKYDITVDGYGEVSGNAPGDAMTHDGAGLLNFGGSYNTRIMFSKMVDDLSDLLASRVSPAPQSGLFAEKAPILIYQS